MIVLFFTYLLVLNFPWIVCSQFWSYIIIAFIIEARREARRAFLAFTSDEAKPVPSTSERGEDDLEDLLDKSAENDPRSPKSTPVSVFHMIKWYRIVVILYFDKVLAFKK